MPAPPLRFPGPCSCRRHLALSGAYRSVLPAAGGPPSRHNGKAFPADALRQPIANAAPVGGYWRGGRCGAARFRNCRLALPGETSLASDAGPAFSGAAFHGHCWALRPASRAPAVSALPEGAARSCGYLRKSNGPWPQQRPGGRYHRMPLSSTFAAGRLVARARIGRKMENAPAFPQVTGLAPNRTKIVRKFEFRPLNSAPSRIRTYAHGSGGRCRADA